MYEILYKTEENMAFEMVKLPYEMKDLEPYMSEQTFNCHYGKHYKTYVDNLNKAIVGTIFENMLLVDIIVKTAGKPEYTAIFNNAAQAWNHEFFWKSMRKNGGGEPKTELKQRLEKDFGSIEKFKETFKAAAVGQFGSGWAWLVDNGGKLEVMKTANADNPLAHGVKPLLTIDVWEHAYYLDYQNRRADFVDTFLEQLVNW